ncbi:MAG TPA: hypothetical protein PLN96_05250 [Zoogloea sp.]|nr:hypothetical protein [Zoogloea sp.]HNA67255.1 hypothetical protein [Rhodocyclaceae bacterium]HNI47243.1 hypothetical protein [Zoogloea sp.]
MTRIQILRARLGMAWRLKWALRCPWRLAWAKTHFLARGGL